jgi:hypothetical protein
MRRLTPVTATDLTGLVCPYCGMGVPQGTAWVGEAEQMWGLCGWRLTSEDGTDAVLLLAPSKSEAGAAMIKQLWVTPERVGGGVGRRLIQGVAAELIRGSTRAVLSRGSRTHVSCSAPPKEFLRAVGFTRQLDERYYRLDLSRAVTNRNPLQSLLDRVAEVLQPGNGKPAAGLSPRSAHRSA